MPLTTSATTELEAINIMLATIGQSPVNNLEVASTSDVAFAKNILAEVNREVQGAGWRFNTDDDVDFVRNGNNEIQIAPNVLRVVWHYTGNIDVVIRGVRAYDRKTKGYTFTANLKADEVVYLLPFTELPESARRFITLRASRLFQDRVQGADAQHVYTVQDEIAARSQLRQDQSRTDQLSLLYSDAVWQVLSRRPRGRVSNINH